MAIPNSTITVQKVDWLPYRLPFAGDFNTAKGKLGVREGLILRGWATNGLVGLGEAAPLPEFGGGAVREALAVLEEIEPKLAGLSLPDLADLIIHLEHQAVRNALDTVYLDLASQADDLPLAQWLSRQQPEAFNPTVPVNATVGATGLAEAVEQARQAVEQGFECIKLKVGVITDLRQEVARVAAVRAAIGPTTKLRLDANGGWSVEQAIRTLEVLEKFDLELVEQPVAGSDIAGLRKVRQAVGINIAADEAVTGQEAARQIIETGAADVLVIKPMVVGGLREGQRIIEMAAQANLPCIVTTTIDSGVGIRAALHLATLLPTPRLHCGLATATLLAATLVEDLPVIQHGQMSVPLDRPGLGVNLDYAQVKRFQG